MAPVFHAMHPSAWKEDSPKSASGILHGRGCRPTQVPPRRRGKHTCQHYTLGWWIEMRPAASQARGKKYPKGIDCALVARRPPAYRCTAFGVTRRPVTIVGCDSEHGFALRRVKRFALLPCCMGMETLPESANDVTKADPLARRLATGNLDAPRQQLERHKATLARVRPLG